MSPDQIDAARPAADWFINLIATHGFWWVVGIGAVAILGCYCALGAAIDAVERRRLRRTPAAPDNVPPVDDDLLIACRRIGREPIADPDTSRRIIRYLRDNAGEEN